MVTWSPPHQDTFKFNVDGAARGGPGLTGIGGVLGNHNGKSSVVFFELVGRKESNKVEIISIRRALTIWISLKLGKLVIESDSTNAIKCVIGEK